MKKNYMLVAFAVVPCLASELADELSKLQQNLTLLSEIVSTADVEPSKVEPVKIEPVKAEPAEMQPIKEEDLKEAESIKDGLTDDLRQLIAKVARELRERAKEIRDVQLSSSTTKDKFEALLKKYKLNLGRTGSPLEFRAKILAKIRESVESQVGIRDPLKLFKNPYFKEEADKQVLTELSSAAIALMHAAYDATLYIHNN